MIHKLSVLLSSYLARQIGWESKIEILTYGFELILGESVKFAFLFGLSSYFEILAPTLLILTTALPLRLINGGGHCTTFFRCTLSTVAVYFLLSFTANKIYPLWDDTLISLSLPLLTAVCLLAVKLWVPGENPQRSFKSDEIKKFKRLSLLFLLLWTVSCPLFKTILPPRDFALYFVSTGLGIAWPNFFVSPLGYRFIYVVESVFNNMPKRTKEVS